MAKFFFLLFTCFCLTSFSSTSTSQIVPISNFSTLLVQNGLTVVLQKGTSPSVKIDADNRIIDYVHVLNNGGKLSIKIKENKFGSIPIKLKHPELAKAIRITVTYNTIFDIFVSGGSNLSTKEPIIANKLLVIVSGSSKVNLQTDVSWLSLNSSGASTCNISGKSSKLNIKCTGASKIYAKNLISKTTDVNLSGASIAEVYAKDELKLTISGASSLKYKAESNTKILKNITGISSVTIL